MLYKMGGGVMQIVIAGACYFSDCGMHKCLIEYGQQEFLGMEHNKKLIRNPICSLEFTDINENQKEYNFFSDDGYKYKNLMFGTIIDEKTIEQYNLEISSKNTIKDQSEKIIDESSIEKYNLEIAEKKKNIKLLDDLMT